MNITEFTPDQKQEIEEGLQAGLDVSAYAKPEFLAIQMQQIRLGLLENLPVACYASTKYDWFQMEEIRKGLSAQVDVKKYADPAVPFDTMRQIREGLESGMDISALKHFPAGILKQFRLALLENVDIRQYIKDGYSEEQLQQIRLAKEKGLDIDPYIAPSQRGTSIQEIAAGLEAGVDVSVYANARMNWQQMREIRLGLMEQIDTSVYQKELYSWQQMKEIRLGLEAGLPVEEYSSLMYTAQEMQKKRLELLEDGSENPHQQRKKKEQKKEHYKNFELYVSADWMEACILLSRDGIKIRKEEMLAALSGKGVITGIDYQVLDELEHGQAKEGILVVAKGTKPRRGKDGWFEFFFDIDLKKQPKVLENGSVDYQNIKCFELIKKDEKVAYYHEAEEGVSGRRINGERIPADKGKELRPLPRRGVLLLPDNKTYVAAADGKIELKSGKLEITNMLVLGDVTQASTNVMFNGAVYIRGFVGDGAVVKATKDIVVDGFVEGAYIESGGDVILRKGNNAGGKGQIVAKGSVMGRFFENATVTAGVDVKANYCLNSTVTAEKSVVITGGASALTGGCIHAGVSIESYDIGNDIGHITQLFVGKDETCSREKISLKREIESVNKELTLLKHAYQEFQKKFAPEIRNTNPMFLKVEDAVYTKEKELSALQEKEEQIEAEAEENKRARVVAQGTIYHGVQVEINGAKWKTVPSIGVTLKKIDGRIVVNRNN